MKHRSEKMTNLIKRQKTAIANVEKKGYEYRPSVTGPYIYCKNTGTVIARYSNSKLEFEQICGI